jgi:hypothetical protein
MKSTLESFFWNQRGLLCGSSGADVTTESASSWTTRPLMEPNTIQSNNSNNYYTRYKGIRETRQHRHVLVLTIGNGTRTTKPTEFPNHYTSMLSANSFGTEDKPKQNASEKNPHLAHTFPNDWPPRHRKTTTLENPWQPPDHKTHTVHKYYFVPRTN